MEKKPKSKQEVINAYRIQASKYDIRVRFFDLFAWCGFDLSGWRKEAIAKLNLKPGDSVIDIGCGTGLNFPLLYQAVGQEGKIIGVDLSDEMLAEAQQRAAAHQWDNVQLVSADASEFEFPESIDAVLSTFAMILIPDCGQVVINACQSLSPRARLVVLDMAWPRNFPLWWRHILFFLRSYGVTADVLRRRPWELVQKNMKDNLTNMTQKNYWFGFFYLCYGAVQG
jgi:demethylmenaquinone methyltransferase/2-methoxy-6-polyprenyl-1,4-benzoquinol methylase